MLVIWLGNDWQDLVSRVISVLYMSGLPMSICGMPSLYELYMSYTYPLLVMIVSFRFASSPKTCGCSVHLPQRIVGPKLDICSAKWRLTSHSRESTVTANSVPSDRL